MGALQVRYMPLALSLNSDCLKLQLFPLQIPQVTESTPPKHTFLSSCTAAHSPWDTAVHSSRYFCTFVLVTQGMGRHTHTKKNQIKKNYGGDSQLASSASLQGWNKPLQSCSRAQQSRSGSQKDLAAQRSRGGREGGSPKPELEPD